MNNTLCLKRFILSLVCLFCLLASAHGWAAQSEARQALEQTVNAVLQELKKPELHNPATRNEVIGTVEKIISQLFDFKELSYRTVGPNWKNFTPDQQTRFTDAFTTLLRETYLEKLEGYNGETVSYLNEEASDAGDRVRIQTSVKVKDKDVPVSYSMMKKDRWVVYDVVIEGVSMVKNYRSQFQDLLLKGDADALIKQVNIKAEEVRQHNAQTQVKQS